MRKLALTAAWFEGAISVESTSGYLKPWRLPHRQQRLFISPDDCLLGPAQNASGVRLYFATDSRRLELTMQPMVPVRTNIGRDAMHVDLTIDGKLLASAPLVEGTDRAVFADLPTGNKVVELWLPHDAPIAIGELFVDDNATARPVHDPRPRWITYGSSLTHCVRAHSPSRTWPAIVARRHGLNLTSLGFGGQCHLDGMIGRLIRDLPADLITLKLGINTASGSLNARTFPMAVMTLVQLIREKHPFTPIGLVSPIGYPPRETDPNVVGYTIGQMREAIAEVWRRLVDVGDENVYYTDGLEVFNLDQIAQYTADQCHPDADGTELMAEQFDQAVMRPLLGLG